MEIIVGQFVFSKAGRDKNRPFIVLKTEDDFAYLVDGDLRKTDAPKKKKLKHIRPTNCISQFVVDKMNKVGKVTNSEIRKELKEFSEKL